MTAYEPQAHWEDRHRRLTELHAVGYLGLGEGYNRWLYRVKRAVFLRHVRHALAAPRRARVLDVGCGSGFFVERWREVGVRDITGVDIAETAIERLRQRHPKCRFLMMDIGDERLPLAAGPFDAVSAFDVLYHIVDDARFARALRNVHGLLRPGGLFVFSDNFLHGPTVRVADQVSHSLHELTRMLRAAGFEPIKRVPLFVLMNYPIDSRSRLATLYWRAVERTIRSREWAGSVVGGALFSLELACAAIMRESPTTEMMLCRASPTVKSV